MTIYTIGYEKKNIEEYIKILKENKIQILIDVREIAWSYKKDFCKTKFNSHLSENGILYLHHKDLGNPKVFRKNITDRTKTLKLYEKYLNKTKNGLEELENVISKTKKKICLTCFEKEHLECHRSIIVKVFSKDRTLKVVNLK